MPAPITSSPLSDWLRYPCTALLMMTVSITRCIDSLTKACSGWLSIGSRMPAMRASTDEWPAATQPTRPAFT